MDYRKFLKAETEHRVLPYFGGTFVDTADRRFRLRGEAEPGFWRFRVEGRYVIAEQRAEAPDLGGCPKLRGHYAQGWLFAPGFVVERLALPPAEEPPALAPITLRRWHSGDYLFDTIDFEDEAEEAARRALEAQAALRGIKGVSASLRAAFGFLLTFQRGTEKSVPVSPLEIRNEVLAIAEGGLAVVDQLLERLQQRRLQHALQRRHLRMTQGGSLTRLAAQAPAERVSGVLEAAGARALACRRTSDTQLEVTFYFAGERFISVVDASTLQVHDAGICLDGADSELTLDSLPAAIREAIDTHQLHITRR